MTKNYKVKWYDWHAGHHKEKECNSSQLNSLFSTLNAKAGISDISITEVNTIELYKWLYTTLLPNLQSVWNIQ